MDLNFFSAYITPKNLSSQWTIWASSSILLSIMWKH